MLSTVPRKVLIAEDHDLFLDGMLNILRPHFEHTQFITCNSYPTLNKTLLNENAIELILIDIQMPGMQGLESLAQIRRSNPVMPIIVVSAFDMAANVQNIMALGMNGFISKAANGKTLIHAIEQVMLGEVITVSYCQNPVPTLSPRERQTLTLLADGKSNKEIAKQLAISDLTVRQYVSSIMEQLQVNNRSQAIIAARKQGLILDEC